MKKYGKFVAVMVAVFVVGMAASAYAAPDRTVSVSMGASILGITSMSITPSSMTFSNTAADAFATTTSGRVTITYASNYNPWKIAIYTNNTQVTTWSVSATGLETGKLAKGGLSTADGKNVVAAKWVAKAPASAAPAIGTISAYNFVKDLRDQDDPQTSDNPATPLVNENVDESWAAGFAAGYPNIAFGSSGSGVCVDPTNIPTYRGDPVTGSISVYVAGLFGTGGVTPAVPASPGVYSSTLYFDLYHE